MLQTRIFVGVALLLLPISAQATAQHKTALPSQDWQFRGTLGADYSNGSYGTPLNTDVVLGLSTLSAAKGNFEFSAGIPYMRISGRGLVVFDASGNAIVINRRTTLPPTTRTGFGDLNLSASYTIPAYLLDDFEVRLTGVTKLPIASERKRLSTGKADFGMSMDVSHQFGVWTPFVTMGYLLPGQPSGYTLKNTISVSMGSSLELGSNLVAIASYDYDSADSPLVVAAQELFGSLSWVRDDGITLTAYGTAGLSTGSPNVGSGLLLSYRFK